MKNKKITLDSLEFFQKLNDSESNVCFLKSSNKNGWQTTITFNPCDKYFHKKGENFENFIKKHQGKKIIGYFSYDIGCEFLDIKQTTKNDLELPDIYFLVFENFITFEKNSATIHYKNESFLKKIIEINKRIPSCTKNFKTSNFISNTNKKEYEKSYKKIKKYLKAGDIYQINLTHRLEAKTDIPSRELFVKIIEKNPVDFLSYIEGEKFEILSASPERFIKIKDKKIETFPIKGTQPRGETKTEDKRFKQKLIKSEKEKAELNMITDLLRNDLGKVCRIGTVQVEKFRETLACPTVWHTYSKITGELSSEYNPIKALKSMLSGGSVTGCPKKRAMEIINELEATSRSIYTGVIVNIDKNLDLDSSIAIRTIIKKQENLYLQVGGGIVLDSEKENEYQETMDKAKSFLSLSNYDFFTTFLVKNGKIKYLKDHLSRLKLFSYKFFDSKKLETQILNFFKNKTGKGQIIFKNNEFSFSISPLLLKKNNFKISIKYIDTPLGDIKKWPFRNLGFQEGSEIILVEKSSGEVLEGNFTNVFVKIKNEYFTPPLNGKILAGIGRKKFIEKLKKQNINIHEKKVTIDMLKKGEIFLTNAVRGVIRGRF